MWYAAAALVAGHSLSTLGARFPLPLPLVIGGLQEQHQDTGHGGGGWGGGGRARAGPHPLAPLFPCLVPNKSGGWCSEKQLLRAC